MTPPPPSAVDFEHAADVAAHVAGWAAIVVVGPNEHRSAQLAVGIARAASATRRVALGDLCGDLAAVYALAGGEDAQGLGESFRDGLGLNEIARPVVGNSSLFVLPAGNRVRDEPALMASERWTRLIGGFGEAGGLLVLVAPEASGVIPVLGSAGAGLVYTGPTRKAPPGITVIATVGATRPPGRRWWRVGAGREYATGIVATAIAAAVLIGGATGAGWIRIRSAADGSVTLPERRSRGGAAGAATTPAALRAADTVAMAERLGPVDPAKLSPFAVEVVAASSASNANSFLLDRQKDASLPAATISVIAVRNGPQRTSKWHTVVVGAWHDAKTADSALLAMRRQRVVDRDGGIVVRAPYAMLLADSASRERARAVVDVWRAKGLAPYALAQDDGTMRVYAGAFETVAQSVTMAAIVHDAGGTPMVAFRTGRPD